MQTTAKDATPLLTTTADVPTTKRNRCQYIILLVIALIVITTAIILIVLLVDTEIFDETLDFEQLFLDGPSASHAKENSYLFTRTPHVAATKENYEYAVEVEKQFADFGFEADIMNYSGIYLSTYNGSSLTQVNPLNPHEVMDTFELSEKYIPDDSTSNTSLRHQAWLGYSASGNVTGYLIYVNYGDAKDFDVLINKLNFDTEGKPVIALVRYGALLRGIKALNAAEYNFSAVILFSDPEDYGFTQGEVIPDGPYLPNSGFQRGSAAYFNRCFGNPSPDRAVDKCGFENEDFILPSIPIIPISYGNARKLMIQMNGAFVDQNELTQEWNGGMNITYRIGTVNENDGVMVNVFASTMYGPPTTISNVRGFIEGTKYKNESIVFGAHRDAWVYGAVDPISGTTSIIEVARAFSKILERGWKPLRNIYFLSWDAEEFDLIGSTEFGEKEEEFVEIELVAYLNQDAVVSGPHFRMAGDPIMEILLKDCMKKVKQPYMNDNDDQTVYDIWSENQGPDNQMTGMLGSGSDFTVFVHEYGIASMDSGFGDGYGTYHSVFDSYFTMSTYIDPEYEYLRAAAQVVGLIGFQIVNNDIIPFNVYNLYARLYGFLEQLDALQTEYNCSIDNINNNLTIMLQDSIEYYGDKAFEFDNAVNKLIEDSKNDNTKPDNYEELVVSYNYAMRTLGTKFLIDSGLPTRQIYKNLITAAAVDNGYAEQVLPFIGYVIKFDCTNDELLFDAYNITSNALRNAGDYLQSFL